MASRRPPRGGKSRDDDWVPPAWNSGATGDAPTGSWRIDRDEPRRPPIQSPPLEPSPRPHEAGLVLGMAIAPGAVGIVSLLLSALPVLSGSGSFPRGLILVLVMQGVVAFLLGVGELRPLLPSWIGTLLCSAVLLPLLAVQVALLREPYVSWGRGSASPALVASVVVGMIVIVGAVWATVISWQHPDEAGLLFLPQAMMVPALIGMHSTIGQRSALQMLGVVLLLAAVATAVSWLIDPTTRLFVPPATLAVEVVGLWLTGHGPWFHPTSGDIVRVLFGGMIALAVVLVVAVPIAAVWVNNGVRMVERAQTAKRRAVSSPPVMPRGPVVPR